MACARNHRHQQVKSCVAPGPAVSVWLFINGETKRLAFCLRFLHAKRLVCTPNSALPQSWIPSPPHLPDCPRARHRVGHEIYRAMFGSRRRHHVR